jgi:hypothetical protein
MPVREVPASIGQRLLWLLDHYRGHAAGLDDQAAWRLRGPLSVPALAAAVDELCRRHDSLRTTLVAEGRRLVQVVHEPRRSLLRVDDVSAAGDPEATLRAAIAEELRTRIDAAVWPVRARLWRLAEDDYALCLNVHHLAVDARSMQILGRDLARLYDREVGAGADLPPAGWQYWQWTEWQEEAFANGELGRLREHWSARLEGAEFAALPRRAAGGGAGRRSVERLRIEDETAGRVRRLAA